MSDDCRFIVAAENGAWTEYFATLGEALECAADCDGFLAAVYDGDGFLVAVYDGDERLPMDGECPALAEVMGAAWSTDQVEMGLALGEFVKGALATGAMVLPPEATACLTPRDGAGWLFAAPREPTGKDWQAPTAWSDARLTARAASTIAGIALARRQGIVPSRGPAGELGWVEAHSPAGTHWPQCYWRWLRGHWCYVSCTRNTLAVVNDHGHSLAVRRAAADSEWVWEWGEIPHVASR